MRRLIIILPTGLLTAIFMSCLNPFAPSFDDSPFLSDDILGDQTTIEGAFQNFELAYKLQDTLIYGQLLAPDFVFEYTDYDRGIPISWGRDVDMRITHRLFNSANNIDLIWLRISQSSGDELNTSVRRSFELTITFPADDIVGIRGYANLVFERDDPERDWKITRWIDESDF